MKERAQSRAEEVANSVTHGTALFAALVAVTFLVIRAADLGGVNVVGTSVFAAAMVLLYVTSTLYHALPHGRSKQLVLKLDHSAIYVFIASSYTPFALGALDSPWAWTIFGLVWSFAVLGGTLTVFDRLSHPGLSTALYLIMGWLVLVAAVPLVEHLSRQALVLLVAGGVAYSVGVLFFILDSRLHYAHAVWHCFVVAGSGCHFFAVLSAVD